VSLRASARSSDRRLGRPVQGVEISEDRVLMWAVRHNQPEVITTLLKAGADVEAQDAGGKTALMYAAQYNQDPEAITVLLGSWRA